MTARELVLKVKSLPLVSVTALKLVNLLDQPTVSNDDIVQVLKNDNVLTAKLLRACNSPSFGLEEPISSVDQAVFLLGHQEILHMVLTLTFGSAMVVPLPGYAVEANDLWQHSLITATAAEVLNSQVAIVETDASVVFTVGLLHDIGKLVLGQALTPDLQTSLRQLIELDLVPRPEAEREILGTDHGEVGACLLQTWNLPEEIIEAVANHHQPLLEPRPHLSVVTHVANCIAHLAGSAPGWDGYAIRVNDTIANAFDITPDKLESMVATVHDSLARVEQLMNMK